MCAGAAISPLVSVACSETASFSFWRILVGISRQLEYQKELTPLSDEVAAQCCQVHPGQAITLVRGGRIVARGEVHQIFAALVPRSGDDRMLFFSVSGVPDSLNVASGPPAFPERESSTHDLYVIGGVSVEEYVPALSSRKAFEEMLAQGSDGTGSIRGTLDYFLKVDGVLHAILRDAKADTGMWGYLVYRLKADQAPELVYSDWSWST